MRYWDASEGSSVGRSGNMMEDEDHGEETIDPELPTSHEPMDCPN